MMRLRAFLLLLLIGGNPAYAGLFNDEEARKQIAAQQAPDNGTAQPGTGAGGAHYQTR